MKYFIKTYGCQMNVADSAKLAGVLETAGYTPAGGEKTADIILVNTCVVRQHAEDRAAWFVTSLKGAKSENPHVKIILCGCLVTEPGRDVKKQFPHVDLFIPPNSPDTLMKYLNLSLGIRHSSLKGEFISIMHGCNNFCSYCVVPYVRGREISRTMEEVLEEIRVLGEQGIRDITLLGQNVNAYKYGLAKLLREIGEIVERGTWSVERRISFLTSHPRDMSDEIIEAVAQLPYVVKDFVMPLQSGDDEILQKMNRGYSLAHYLNRVEKIRTLIPQARISTDIIVGFPGETEAQFENTLRALEQIKFNDVHMFAYSARPTVAAAKLPDQLPEAVKQARLQKLIQVVRENLLCYNAR
jgi:tRNA-2-methylthio-N6-dimethylallyladenosine synthase